MKTIVSISHEYCGSLIKNYLDSSFDETERKFLISRIVGYYDGLKTVLPPEEFCELEKQKRFYIEYLLDTEFNCEKLLKIILKIDGAHNNFV